MDNGFFVNENIKAFILFFGFYILGALCTFIFVLNILKRIPSKSDEVNKEKEKVKTLMALLRTKMDKKNIFEKSIWQGTHNIGIYGAGELGQILFEIFDKERKPIKCIIDRSNPKFEINNIEWRKPDDNLDDLDFVIITTYDPDNEILNKLKIDKGKVISIGDFALRLLYEK